MTGGTVLDLFGHEIPPDEPRRTRRMSDSELTMEQWQKLLTICPIVCSGKIHTGGFLACSHVSQTQFSIARHFGGCTIKGREFIYLPEHDMLVRADFHAWAMRNRNRVLDDAAAGSGDMP